jgi:hypothetical protein
MSIHAGWIGPLVAILGLVGYFNVFARFPVTRDVPWVNLSLVLLGLGLSAWAVGCRRSLGSIAGLTLSLACTGLLAGYVFVLSNQLPGTSSVVAVHEPAPGFALTNQDGQTVRLTDFEGSNLVLVFYRGFW